MNWAKLKFMLCLLPAGLGYLLVLCSRMSPRLTEQIYCNKIYPVVRRLQSPFGLLPFSLAEILLFTCAVTGILCFFYILIVLRRSSQRKEMIIKTVKIIALTASSIYFIFAVTCAPNYNRLTFAELSGLTVENAEVTALADMCSSLIAAANDLSGQRDAQPSEFAQLAQSARQSFASLEGVPFISRVTATPKPMIFSEVLSYLQVTGFYFAYTGEATINTDIPRIEMPFTMCHELAHTVGFMREDEANFIAYLAGSVSEDPFVRYSVTVCALNHCMNALYRHDTQLYDTLRSQYSERLSQDVTQQSRYWAKYDTPVAEMSERVNSAYLKANNQADGTHSYGRMVDLMIAYEKAQREN